VMVVDDGDDVDGEQSTETSRSAGRRSIDLDGGGAHCPVPRGELMMVEVCAKGTVQVSTRAALQVRDCHPHIDLGRQQRCPGLTSRGRSWTTT